MERLATSIISSSSSATHKHVRNWSENCGLGTEFQGQLKTHGIQISKSPTTRILSNQQEIVYRVLYSPIDHAHYLQPVYVRPHHHGSGGSYQELKYVNTNSLDKRKFEQAISLLETSFDFLFNAEHWYLHLSHVSLIQLSTALQFART
ncbi:hypothetical protein HOY82DRAFT_619863 [Tuber indicum]|nr:hypothetical protein HOY82DRAFT_619863 [Tuber indicum]